MKKATFVGPRQIRGKGEAVEVRRMIEEG